MDVPRGHGEDPDQLALGTERRGEKGPGAGLHEPVSQILAKGQLLILEDVAREDGASLEHGAGHQSVTRLEDVPKLEEAHGRAGPRDGLELSVGAHETQAGRVHPEDGQDAAHDAVGHLGDVQALREHPRDLRQLLCLATTARALGEEPGIADGHRGLGRKRGQELAVVLGGQVLAAEVEGEHAEEIVARHHGDAREREEPVSHRPLPGPDTLVRRHVLHEERPPVSRDPARPSRVDAHGGGELVGVDGGHGRPRPANEQVARLVDLPEDDAARAGEPGQRLRDLDEEGLELELLRERDVDVGEGPEPPLALIQRGVSLPLLADRAIELIRQLRQLVVRGDGDGRSLGRFEAVHPLHERGDGALHAGADEPRHEKGDHGRRA